MHLYIYFRIKLAANLESTKVNGGLWVLGWPDILAGPNSDKVKRQTKLNQGAFSC